MKKSNIITFYVPEVKNQTQRIENQRERRFTPLPFEYEPCRANRFFVYFPSFEEPIDHGVQEVKIDGEFLKIKIIYFINFTQTFEKIKPGTKFDMYIDLVDPTGEKIIDYFPLQKVKVVKIERSDLSYSSDDLMYFTLTVKPVKSIWKRLKSLFNF